MLTRTGAASWLISVVILLLRAPEIAQTVDRVGSASFPTALLALLELGLLGLAVWVAVSLGLCALGGTVAATAAHLLPAALRGLLVVGVAGTLTATAAHAEPGRHGAEAPSTVLDGLVLPERPGGDSAVDPGPPRPDGPVTTEPGGRSDDGPTRRSTVRVGPGDTLWSIAARHLGDDATTADVARATRQWHEANRDVLGDDPDLVRPGQRLVTPRSLR